MLKLIKNEYMKIFLKKSTYVVLAICLLLSVGISLLIQFAYDETEEYYYSEMSITDEMGYYTNSEDIYDQIYYLQCSIYTELGYEYYKEIPDWILSAVYDATFEHYAYVLISQAKDVAEAEMNMGMSIEGVDLEYEQKIYDDIVAAIKAGDYKTYFQVKISHYEEQKKNNKPYSAADYEYYKYMLEKEINPETDEDKLDALNVYIYAKTKYDALVEQREAGENVSDYEIESQKKVYILYQYILDNDIEYYMTETLDDSSMLQINSNKFITAITSNTMISGMAGIFVMIIAAGIIANEFSNGTIKFLLINPVKRAKIFWSKYLTCISLLISSLTVFFALYLLFCMITCGTDGMSGVYLSYADGMACEESILIYSLKQYVLSGVSLLTSVTLAFTISSLMRSNAIAIAISLVIEFLGATITVFLCGFGHDWARYLIFANTDLASIAQGTSIFPGQTLGFALAVVVIYMVIYLLTAYDAFKKKEV